LTYPIWTWYCPRATDIDIGRDQAQPSIPFGLKHPHPHQSLQFRHQQYSRLKLLRRPFLPERQLRLFPAQTGKMVMTRSWISRTAVLGTFMDGGEYNRSMVAQGK
jgi:hypothetical protein